MSLKRLKSAGKASLLQLCLVSLLTAHSFACLLACLVGGHSECFPAHPMLHCSTEGVTGCCEDK